MTLVLEEFYKNIRYVAVSSKTGEGFGNLIDICQDVLANYKSEVEKSS